MRNKYLNNVSDFVLSLFPLDAKDFILGCKRYRFSNGIHPKQQLLIQFVDGRTIHGGMADRFKGMISAFSYCLCRDIPFRIHHISPYQLSDYLQPNMYDWRLREGEMTNNIFEATLINISGSEQDVRRLHKLHTVKQLHCYFKGTDMLPVFNELYHQHYEWGELFKMLFKPATKVQEQIDYCLSVIGGEYVAVVFRFQNLLGDFKEYNYSTLDREAQKMLISKCKNALLEFQRNMLHNCKILVTSDSYTFLTSLADMEGIVVFPSPIVHVDTTSKESYDVYAKSFVDFYLLAGAEALYSIEDERMYSSNFPTTAARLEQIPFERIKI